MNKFLKFFQKKPAVKVIEQTVQGNYRIRELSNFWIDVYHHKGHKVATACTKEDAKRWIKNRIRREAGA